MSDVTILVVLYVLGVSILVTEVFIPSHGLLTLVGVGFLAAAVVKTFNYAGREAGTIAVLACLVFVPTFAIVAIKYWHRTPIGRLIAPPNPVLTKADAGTPVEELSRLVGHLGTAVSPLRPVGVCEFNGLRVSCVAEFGMIETGVNVEGTGIKGSNLIVSERNA